MSEHLQAGLVPRKPKRVGISKRRRFEILKRDSFMCQYCGAHPPGVLLHVDHIKAVAEGGSNDDGNLITACEPCNLGKGAVSLSSVPESMADTAARIAEAEEQLAGYMAIMEARRDRIEDDCWAVIEVLTGEYEIRRERFQSIKLFVERLGVVAVKDAADIARAKFSYNPKRAFLYLCGICWNQIKAQDGQG